MTTLPSDALPPARDSALPTRRALLRVAAAGSAMVPFGAVAAGRFGLFQPEAPIRPEICHVATAPEAVADGAPRELKLTWNANAICTVGVPVADQRGIF